MSDEQDLAGQREADALQRSGQPKEKYSDAYYHRPSVVYFIAAGWNPVRAIKIGVTARSTVAERMRSIQTSNHERLSLLGIIEFLDGDKPGLQAENAEKELHKKFHGDQRASALSVGAEWFDPSVDLMRFIEELPPLPLKLAGLYPHTLAERMADQAQWSREYILSVTED